MKFYHRLKKYIKKDKESGKYLFFSGVFLSFLLVVFSIFSYVEYHSHKKELQNRLFVGSQHVNDRLTQLFDETNRLMIYVGKQIASYDEYDKNISKIDRDNAYNAEFVSRVLLNASESITQKNDYLQSWYFFDWTSQMNLQVVNSQVGVSKNPPDMSHRSYIHKCRGTPWKLYMSSPSIDIPAGVWVIPGGTGITDRNKTYLGTLTVGFSVAELNAMLQSLLSAYKMSFLVLDEDFGIILQSFDNAIDPKSTYYRNLLRGLDPFSKREGLLKEPISYKKIRYLHYKKMRHYPYYIILTGFDTSQVTSGLFSIFTLPILGFLFVGFFGIFLFYFMGQRIVTSAKQSDKLKEDFMTRLHHQTKGALKGISEASSALLGNLRGEPSSKLSTEKQIHFVNMIQNSVMNIQSVTTNLLDLTYVDVNKVLRKCVAVQSKAAFLKEVRIEVREYPDLPLIYADELRLQQIFLGLLSLSIDYIPRKGEVQIATELRQSKEKPLLVLVVQDNGFRLEEEDLNRINEKFNSKGLDHKIGGFTLDLSSVRKLIEMHHGTFTIQNTGREGKIMTLEFPYNKKKDFENPLPSAFPEESKKEGKIYDFKSEQDAYRKKKEKSLPGGGSLEE